MTDISKFVEVQLKEEDDFLKVRETLTRIGVSSRKERMINLHVGRKMTLFNTWETKPFEQYNVDKSFYLSEATKLVQSVINNQLTL